MKKEVLQFRKNDLTEEQLQQQDDQLSGASNADLSGANEQATAARGDNDSTAFDPNVKPAGIAAADLDEEESYKQRKQSGQSTGFESSSSTGLPTGDPNAANLEREPARSEDPDFGH